MRGMRPHILQKIIQSNSQGVQKWPFLQMVEKLKALGYFPLLMLGKYRPQNKKWTAQLQCPFELPVVAHAVLEKIVCLFEGLLEGQLGQTGRWDNMEIQAQEDSVEGERVERGEIEEQNELQVVETEEPMGQQERTGEEDKVASITAHWMCFQ
ncbi:MORC family CW-type zinc finger 3-like protein [Labeo rohita]|uniref:MORC family CW-type zinc finger 3-like protein n=1 Tax=Labeo rohita TaxID=84645 RepID=A0A498NR64_LABRO|nr:MORC family CW-type zinc finger 3-like protein [Labeo rohita]